MSRSRNIKPGFFKNEDLVELPFATRLLYIGLWCEADREGRFEDRPSKLRMAIFPANDVNVDGALQQLHDAGFILRYEHQGKRYGQVIEWKKHQNPHFKEQMSVIPSPESLGLDRHAMKQKPQALVPLNEDETSGFGSEDDEEKPENCCSSDQKASGFALMDGGGSPADSLIPDSLIPDSLQDQDLLSEQVQEKRLRPINRFPDFWAVYPIKKGKAAAEAKWIARKLDAIADKIIADVKLRLATDRQWLDGYIPHGSTYVHGKGWEDAIEPLSPQRTNGSKEPSKSMRAMQNLEELRHEILDGFGNNDGLPAPYPALPGQSTRR